MASRDTKCNHCGEPLADSHNGACPNCGKEGKIINESITEGIVLTDSIGWQTTKEFYEKNHKALAGVVAISVVSPFIGLFVAGIPGVVVGLLLGSIAYILGPKAVTKVREIRIG